MRRVNLLALACGSILACVYVACSWADSPDDQPPLPAVWHLVRDSVLDNKVGETEHVPLELTVVDRALFGQFQDQKAGGNVNKSVFSGEIVAREKKLLILRQELENQDGRYVVVHVGHEVGANHYRGAWHDNSGQSGDFELHQK